MNGRDRQPGIPAPTTRPAGQITADPTAWMDHGQLTRYRRWQERTFYVNPGSIEGTRRASMILAMVLLTAVFGIVWLVFLRYTGVAAVSVALYLLVVGGARGMLVMWRAGKLASFALSGPPPPGPPKLPTEFRLCPVCGSILRVRQLEYGWAAVCPACGYRLLLED